MCGTICKKTDHHDGLDVCFQLIALVMSMDQYLGELEKVSFEVWESFNNNPA